MSRRLNHDDYTIVWVAVLPTEAEAALGMLDKKHEGHFESARGDDYIYIGGEVNGHNVVIATLPAGQNYGVGAAAALVNQVKSRFSNIWFALLVGVAAGLPNLTSNNPSRRRDIRLGDVLVCVPDKACSGIVHYDLGRDTEYGFSLNGRQAESPAIVRSAIGHIRLTEKKPYKQGNKFAQMLGTFQESQEDNVFACPSQESDQLYASHADPTVAPEGVRRESRDESERTRVWYGSIGSGNSLMRNPRRRDDLRDMHDLIGLEMEAAGVMNTLPTGVIRGVCDYGDGHKNKEWQPYAAAVAAVYAKGVLCCIHPKSVPKQSGFGLGLHLRQAPVMDASLFVGRLPELKSMEDILMSGDRSTEQRQLILGGMGGIGKTQLVIEYARRYQHFYGSVFWLNATSETTLKASFRLIAQRILQAQEYENLDDERILLRVREWLSDTRNTPWLLIFDNYDDPDKFDMEGYYPYTAQGFIIITTRRPDLVSGRQVRVQPLARVEESLKVLETRSQRENVRANLYARRLAERLGGLPLALATAGAYLRESAFTFEQYLQEYERRWNIDARRPLKLREYQDRTLYTTWNLSYARLESDDSDAAQMLKLLAYFDNQNIWYELLHAGIADDLPIWLHNAITDPVRFESVMRTLVDYCFVEVQTAAQCYSMHQCVHDWALAGLNSVVDGRHYWYVFDCVAASIDKDDWESFRLLRYTRLTPHAIRLVHNRFQQDDVPNEVVPDRNNEAVCIAALLAGQVQLTSAEKMYERALAGYEKALGPEHTSTLRTVNNLGSLYADQGKLDEAEQMYQRALAGFEKALGPEHTSTLRTVNNLSNLYTDQGKLDEAKQMYQRALAGYEKALGPEHTSTLSTVNNLGSLYTNQGKLDEAEQMYQRALAGYEKALGPKHTSTLDTVNNLGSLYVNQGKLDEAEQMYQRALAGKEKALGQKHASTLNTVHNLGLLYTNQGKLDEAEQMYQRALAGYEKALGPKHTSTLGTVNNLGLLYTNQGKLDEAEQMYQRALAGYEKALGPEHTSTLSTVNNLGSLYADQGKLDEAEQMYQRALAGYEKALGPKHTSTLSTVNNLGSLYTDQGKLDEAEQMYQRVLAGKEKALGPEHTSTLRTVNNLGSLYTDQGKLDEAEQMYQRALVGYEKALGPEHTWTLSTVNNLGSLYADQGKLDEAKQMYQRALAGFEKALGPKHTSTLRTVNNLGNLYANQGKLDEAEQMYQRALAGFEKALGPKHTSTLDTVNNLGLLYADQGKLDEAEQMFARARNRRIRL